ncbi:MAG: hypothetical protein WEF50_11160 [Myxococcota bacterium]
MSQSNKEREKILESIETQKAGVAELECGRDALVKLEHELTAQIAKAPPVETVEARTRRVAVLEAIADTVNQLEKARERVKTLEHDLEVSDALTELKALREEYDGLRTSVNTELQGFLPWLVRMDQIAARHAWLEKAVVRVAGDSTQSYFPRPTGAIGFSRSTIKLMEARYVDFQEGIGD